MPAFSRRSLLGGLGAAAAGVALDAATAPAAGAAPAPAAGTSDSATCTIVAPGPVTVTPSDRRYADLSLRGYNRRCVSNPESVRIVGTTDHGVPAVNDAVSP